MNKNIKYSIIGMSNLELAEMIGEFIKYNRLKQNKTQEELSIQSGVKRTTISKIENGSYFNINTFLQLIRYLDVLDTVMDTFKLIKYITPYQNKKMQVKERQRSRRNASPNELNVNKIHKEYRKPLTDEEWKDLRSFYDAHYDSLLKEVFKEKYIQE